MGAAVPPWMVEPAGGGRRRGGGEAVRHEGVAIATELCEQLLRRACRAALLHPQPIERDPGDLRGAASAARLAAAGRTRLRRWRRPGSGCR